MCILFNLYHERCKYSKVNCYRFRVAFTRGNRAPDACREVRCNFQRFLVAARPYRTFRLCPGNKRAGRGEETSSLHARLLFFLARSVFHSTFIRAHPYSRRIKRKKPAARCSSAKRRNKKKKYRGKGRGRSERKVKEREGLRGLSWTRHGWKPFLSLLPRRWTKLSGSSVVLRYSFPFRFPPGIRNGRDSNCSLNTRLIGTESLGREDCLLNGIANERSSRSDW